MRLKTATTQPNAFMRKSCPQAMERLNQSWAKSLPTLRRQARSLAYRAFFRFDEDEILNELYLRLVRRVQNDHGLPLKYDQLLGYLRVALTNTMRDLQRKAFSKRRLWRQWATENPSADAPRDALPLPADFLPESTQFKRHAIWANAWNAIHLNAKETRVLKVWFLAKAQRSLALEWLGLQDAPQAEKQRAYDRPLNKAKRKLRRGLRHVWESVDELNDPQERMAFAGFIKKCLAAIPRGKSGAAAAK